MSDVAAIIRNTGIRHGEAVSMNVVTAILAPFRMAQKTMLDTKEVQRCVGYKDKKSVVALIQRDLGGFKIGGRWRVHIGKLEHYLTQKYNPSISDRVDEMLKPRVHRKPRNSKVSEALQ